MSACEACLVTRPASVSFGSGRIEIINFFQSTQHYASYCIYSNVNMLYVHPKHTYILFYTRKNSWERSKKQIWVMGKYYDRVQDLVSIQSQAKSSCEISTICVKWGREVDNHFDNISNIS